MIIFKTLHTLHLEYPLSVHPLWSGWSCSYSSVSPLVVVVVQSAVIWHQRRSAPAFSQWYKISEEDFLSKNIGVIMS